MDLLVFTSGILNAYQFLLWLGIYTIAVAIHTGRVVGLFRIYRFLRSFRVLRLISKFTREKKIVSGFGDLVQNKTANFIFVRLG